MLKDILSLIKGLFLSLASWLVAIIFFGAGVTLYLSYREARRKEQPVYIKGVITDRYQGKGVYNKGTSYFEYTFKVNGKTYVNSAFRSLCSECKDISCIIGDSVLIEYKKDNPKNNTPVCKK